MSYTIEKNIPMPATGGSGGRKGKYPWNELEIGDSFLVVNKEISLGQRHRGWRPQPSKNLRDIGYKTSSRYITEGVRVWRVE